MQGQIPGQKYNWMHPHRPVIRQIKEMPQNNHVINFIHMIELYDAMDNNFGQAFDDWCNDPICLRVVKQMHIDRDNKLIPVNDDVYQTLLIAYNNAFNVNLEI